MQSNRNSKCGSELSSAELQRMHKKSQGWLEKNSCVRYPSEVATDGIERTVIYHFKTGKVHHLDKMAFRSVRQQAKTVAKEENQYQLDCEKEPGPEEQYSEDTDPTYRAVVSKIEFQALREAISILRASHRDVILWRMQELTFKEISEKLQVPENTVISRFTKAVELLRANVKLKCVMEAEI